MNLSRSPEPPPPTPRHVEPSVADALSAEGELTRQKSRRFLLGLLVVAWVVIDVVLLVVTPRFVHAGDHWHIIAVVTFLACFFGQFATLAGWLSVGTGSQIMRGTACLLGFATLQGMFCLLSPFPGDASRWFTFSCVYFVMIATLFGGLRLYGLRCITPEQLATAKGRLQFTILQIFWLTTATAILLALIRNIPWNFPGNNSLEFVSITLTLAATACLTWLIMFRLPWALGMIAVAVMALCLGFVAGKIEGGQVWPWLGFSTITALGLAANLAVLRVCGYRLVVASRRGKSSLIFKSKPRAR